MRNFRRTASSVSLINYHFVFCPKYRNKIFDIYGVENLFKKTVKDICIRNDFQILALECHHDHVHLFLNVLPKYSPAEIMRIIKSNTSSEIMKQFKLLRSKSLWTRSYFVSTAGDVSSETIKKYIDTQKTRP